MQIMDSVCREDIADSLQGAFDVDSRRSAAELVEYAADHGAPRGVVRTLQRLHREDYRSLRDLWMELADVPVEH